jgi:hypothetical protein
MSLMPTCCLLVVRPLASTRKSKRHTTVLSGAPSEILCASFAKEMLGGKSSFAQVRALVAQLALVIKES